MPIPIVITDLSANANANGPAGTDSPSILDDHQRAHGAFIRQLYDMLTAGAASRIVDYCISCSDLTTALTATAAANYFRASRPFTIAALRASLLTASTSGPVEIDVKVNGSSILSTRLTIPANTRTSVGAVQPVITSAAVPDDAEVVIAITQAGTGAAGLQVSFVGS